MLSHKFSGKYLSLFNVKLWTSQILFSKNAPIFILNLTYLLSMTENVYFSPYVFFDSLSLLCLRP